VKVVRIICIVVVCLWALPAFAQDKPTDTMDTMEIVREAMKSDKRAFIALNMDLTEAEGEKFWPLYDGFQAELEKVTNRLGDVIGEYAKDYKALSDEKAKQLVDEWLAIEAQKTNFKKDSVSKFEAVLPSKKIMRYYQLENKIWAMLLFELAAKIPLAK
jgi:hypothetical protein